MENPPFNRIKVHNYRHGNWASKEEWVVPEHFLEVFLNDRSLVQIACLGSHLDELAVGFLYTEGYVEQFADIKDMMVDTSQWWVKVYTHRPVPTLPSKTVLASSGARFNSEEIPPHPNFTPSVGLSPERVFNLVEEMVLRARVHEVTGGTHSAALANESGILCLREDIGRHNCLDMLAGYGLMNGLDVSDKWVLRTGRVSTEIIKKVARMGVRMVISLSVPTMSAIELARQWGITLIGRVRNGEMIIY